jgi:hypothetical protein
MRSNYAVAKCAASRVHSIRAVSLASRDDRLSSHKPSYRFVTTLDARRLPTFNEAANHNLLKLQPLKTRTLMKFEVKEGRSTTILPRGDSYAQLLRKSWTRQGRALPCLRWQIWSRPALFMANRTLFKEVCRSPQGSPGKRPELAALAPNRRRPSDRESREGSMRIQQISQRGKQYLKTAETLVRAARTMTDRAIAGQLKALADDYERRAEKASHVDAAKALARSTANAEGECW